MEPHETEGGLFGCSKFLYQIRLVLDQDLMSPKGMAEGTTAEILACPTTSTCLYSPTAMCSDGDRFLVELYQSGDLEHT